MNGLPFQTEYRKLGFMIDDQKTITWLLEGDLAVQYQIHRDLLHSRVSLQKKLQARIEKEGWGAQFLSKQQENGHWGRGFYQPKWTSTHYTLLDLKNIGLAQDNIFARKSVRMIFEQAIGQDGSVNYSKTLKDSDVCINGMVVNFAAYFRMMGKRLDSLIEYLLATQMRDGGWNCEHVRGATHSSLHTTISVLEGLLEYKKAGGDHRIKEIEKAELKGIEFILIHRLYQSHRTGKIIDKKMLMLSYPSRWRSDILRALDYFQAARIEYDSRMDPAIEILLKKRRRDRRWPVQMKHPGQVHFDMEATGRPSRWNTLRALRVLNHFQIR